MDVQQQEVGLQLGDQPGRFGSSSSAAQELVVGAAKQHLEGSCNHRMIVDEKDTGHAAAPARGRLISTLVDPGAETNRIVPLARSTRSFSDQGSANVPPSPLEKPRPLSATLSSSRPSSTARPTSIRSA